MGQNNFNNLFTFPSFMVREIYRDTQTEVGAVLVLKLRTKQNLETKTARSRVNRSIGLRKTFPAELFCSNRHHCRRR